VLTGLAGLFFLQAIQGENANAWEGVSVFIVKNGRRMVIRGALTLGILGSAWMSTPAAQLPVHISDYPVEAEKYPLEIEASVDKVASDSFLAIRKTGVEPFVNYWGDFLANPSGGNWQSASWTQLLIFGAQLHLDELIGLKGGSVMLSATDVAGSNLSLKIGNVFTVSQAYVMNTIALYNLYFKQELIDDVLEVRVGRMAAGQLFASLPVMGLPVSGAVNGNPTSLFTNAPFTSTASATWAAYTRVKPTPETYVQAGVFQATPRLGNPAYHGTDFSIRPGDGTLTMVELGWLPGSAKSSEKAPDGKTTAKEAVMPGVYSFGAYYSHYTFAKFSGGAEHNAYGFYAQAQQMVWRSETHPDHNMTLWGGVTYSPQTEIALLPVMGYGGVVWQGLVPGRDEDQAMMSFYVGGFSSDYARNTAQSGAGWATAETVLEWSYVVQLSKNVQIQPDIQYIFRPSGLSSIPNALVIGFQVGVEF
jgi:porin